MLGWEGEGVSEAASHFLIGVPGTLWVLCALVVRTVVPSRAQGRMRTRAHRPCAPTNQCL
jgi:hypothetical protein